MQYSNIHTHTTYSDGKNSPEEMARKAISLGFVSLGFSDHSETVYDAPYCLSNSDIPSYRDHIRSLSRQLEGEIEVLCGIEKDALSEIDPEGFDYVIGSVHYLVRGEDWISIDRGEHFQKKALAEHFGGDRMEFAKRYYEAVVNHAYTKSFSVLGHFDLITKFGFFDDLGEAYEKLAQEAMEEVLRYVPYVEINTGAISRGFRNDPYPSRFLLELVLKKGGRVVVNSDAHCAEHLDTHFDKSLSLLREVGFSSLWQLRKGGFAELSLLE
ncbi:MAG: histidinol-phosphatase [Clostridia bacterium]|nr:histidinol-phosphatase [Clostridia bacterium]